MTIILKYQHVNNRNRSSLYFDTGNIITEIASGQKKNFLILLQELLWQKRKIYITPFHVGI